MSEAWETLTLGDGAKKIIAMTYVIGCSAYACFHEFYIFKSYM